MKRTTIMVEEDLLYDLQQIAQRQGESTSSVIREALASYVTGSMNWRRRRIHCWGLSAWAAAQR